MDRQKSMRVPGSLRSDAFADRAARLNVDSYYSEKERSFQK
jgi:hypothetical protein